MYLWSCIHLVLCMTLISPQLIHITSLLSWLKFCIITLNSFPHTVFTQTHNCHLLMCCFHPEDFWGKALRIWDIWKPNGPMYTHHKKDKVQFEATFTQICKHLKSNKVPSVLCQGQKMTRNLSLALTPMIWVVTKTGNVWHRVTWSPPQDQMSFALLRVPHKTYHLNRQTKTCSAG